MVCFLGFFSVAVPETILYTTNCMQSYDWAFTESFTAQMRLYSRRRASLRSELMTVAIKLARDPFDRRLHTKKVRLGTMGVKYLSKVNNKYYVVWDYNKDKCVFYTILLNEELR